MSKSKPFSEQIRHALRDCGRSRYSLSKATGISEPVLSRFASGERGIGLATLDKLAAELGLAVVVVKRKQLKRSK